MGEGKEEARLIRGERGDERNEVEFIREQRMTRSQEEERCQISLEEKEKGATEKDKQYQQHL